jgi:adhesin/invasin
MHLFRRPLVSLTLLALVGCGGGDLVLPNEGQPTDVAIVRGDRQTGTILEPAPDSLVVRVTDPFGNPVPGVEIAWSAEGGGEVRPTTAVTGNDGRAATQRLLGEQPGNYGTTAVATALPEDVVSFTTTAVAAKLVLLTQPGPTATSGAPIDPQPVLQLQDPSGNPLARVGVSVTVQIATGDGSLRGGTTRVSDATGTVTFNDLAIVGAPGARTLIFAASGYSPAISTPVSLGVGAPASVTIAVGDGQTAAIETKVSTAPAVLVRDAAGTPVASVAVTFAVASGGGSVEGGDAITGADGTAAVGGWTLGQTLGSNTLTATVQSDNVSGNPVTFTATATPGPPSADRSTISATPGTIAASNGSVASAVTIIVRDSRGNPLGGQTVTLAATGSGVTLTQPGATDGSGSTSARFSATSAGDHVIRASIGEVALGSATVKVTPGPVVASQTSVTVPDGTAGTTTAIDITLKDEFGNPVPGAAGQITVAVTGPNAVGALPVSDQGGGNYRALYEPHVVGTDQIDVRVGGQPVSGSPFASAVKAGPPDPGRTTAVVPDGTFGQTVNILVFLADAQGNRIGADAAVIKVDIQGIGPLEVVYAGDGIYVARWTPRVIGTFKVDITLNGTPIAGSPFTMHVGFF